MARGPAWLGGKARRCRLQLCLTFLYPKVCFPNLLGLGAVIMGVTLLALGLGALTLRRRTP